MKTIDSRFIDEEMATDLEVSEAVQSKQDKSEKNQPNGYAGILYPADYGGTAWSVVKPNGVEIHKYIGNYPVAKDGVTKTKNEAMTELDLNGLYIRMTYHSVGSTDVNCNVGIEAYS